MDNLLQLIPEFRADHLQETESFRGFFLIENSQHKTDLGEQQGIAVS